MFKLALNNYVDEESIHPAVNIMLHARRPFGS